MMKSFDLLTQQRLLNQTTTNNDLYALSLIFNKRGHKNQLGCDNKNKEKREKIAEKAKHHPDPDV